MFKDFLDLEIHEQDYIIPKEWDALEIMKNQLELCLY